MLFIVIILIALVPVRRIGWFISKNFLYFNGPKKQAFFISILGTILWAIVIALLVNIMIQWLQPPIIIRIIFGYFGGIYLSIPNYGLFNIDALPPQELKRTTYMHVASLVVFIITTTFVIFIK